MDVNAWVMHGYVFLWITRWIIHIAWIMRGQCMDNTYCMDNAWTMYGYVLVDNKMDNNAWVMFHDYYLVDNKISDISLTMFLWVTRWLLLH